MQAAEVLGIPAEDVRPSIVDTDSVGYTDVTGGSRTTYATGFAAWKAANNLVSELKNRVALYFDRKLEDVSFDSGVFTVKTDTVNEKPEKKISFNLHVLVVKNERKFKTDCKEFTA